jgi:hypothetical protein
MAEHLATLLARPTFRVEKVALFCRPASGGTFSSTAIEIIKWVNFFVVASSLWRLGGRLDCRCRPLPGPESESEVKTYKSEGVPASCGLGPDRTWNTNGKVFVSLSLLSYSKE